MALIDTGADISCPSCNLVNVFLKEKLTELNPSALSIIKGVGEQPIKVLGTVDLSLKILGLTLSQSFVVLENMSFPVILGVDFLTAHQASLKFAIKSLHTFHPKQR